MRNPVAASKREVGLWHEADQLDEPLLRQQLTLSGPSRVSDPIGWSIRADAILTQAAGLPVLSEASAVAVICLSWMIRQSSKTGTMATSSEHS
jgi:hypothetical protein